MNERRAAVALIGLVRVSTDKQKTRRQHGVCSQISFTPPREARGREPREVAQVQRPPPGHAVRLLPVTPGLAVHAPDARDRHLSAPWSAISLP